MAYALDALERNLVVIIQGLRVIPESDKTISNNHD